MNSKQVIFFSIFFLVLYFSPTKAQSWLEGTPNWEYDYQWYCIYQELGYERILYEKDTLIEGHSMKLFTREGYRVSYDYTLHWELPMILFDTLDRMYIYENGGLQKLYDFNYIPGDSLFIPISVDSLYSDCDPILILQLDTVEIQLFNSVPLRVQKWDVLTNQSTYGESIEIVEKMGAMGNYFLRMRMHWNCGLDQCHPFFFGCYYNEAIGISYPSPSACAGLVSSPILPVKSEEVVRLFPNPTTGEVRVESEEPVDRLEVFNWQGQRVAQKTGGKELYLTGQPAGIYIVSVHFSDGRRTVKKLILIR